MKRKNVFLVMIIVIASAMPSFATIWRLNNSGIPADFTSLQSAHDNANVLDGDTFHLEPSINSYGNLNCTKKLIIFGPGYFLDQNPNNQHNLLTAKVGDLNILSSSQGSVFSGLVCLSYVLVKASNIAFLRNYFGGNIYLNHNNNPASLNSIIFNGNYNVVLRDDGNNYNITNLIISNNFITYMTLSNYVTAVIENNVFYETYGVALTAKNSVLKNNVFYGYSIALAFVNCTFYNNIDFLAHIPAGNNNQQNVVMSSVFVGPTGNSTDGQWALSAGSPAIGAGFGGVDCGMFGGTNPYKLSGLPTIPSVYFLAAPSTSNGNILPVTISVKSNN